MPRTHEGGAEGMENGAGARERDALTKAAREADGERQINRVRERERKICRDAVRRAATSLALMQAI